MSQDVKKIDEKSDQALSQSLAGKSKYLQRLQDALDKDDDLLVYKLLNTTKYYHVMKQRRYTDSNNYQTLVKDLRPELSHHLSHRLIKYLKKTYPFFYYYEDQLGHYQVYFGDWWGHKLFGSLDVINVEFNFDNKEFAKLKRAFNDQHFDTQDMKAIQQQNSRLTELAKTQDKRSNEETELKADLKANKSQARMPWNSNRINAEYAKIIGRLKKLSNLDKQADDAKARIKGNQQKMLKLSTENTVIDYEKKSVKKYFGDLSQFNDNNKQLYYNYVSNLLAGGKD
ncbi:exonuclease SbcC [Acetilactobacillus jinshanensis]|uniref:Exonuclease SbcC n=1 Tax=Acetilactobacillus jinshanensis TaxID=1720083 RepID=A0A4P6ZM10_9LACO|nr:exonuclease SbcC [Acetilactobacillus jinshanensis]QBP18643.1 exonuclease SbcC [Acetilactobacillus jinshanensis]URL61519.1 exonuclease SbcC [uncultured bacterium]